MVAPQVLIACILPLVAIVTCRRSRELSNVFGVYGRNERSAAALTMQNSNSIQFIPEPIQEEHALQDDVYKLEETYPKYNFAYGIKDRKGNNYGHRESRDGEKTWGSYYVHLPDGRLKTVMYWADDSGFHAEVIFEGEATRYESPQDLLSEVYHSS